MGLQEFAAWWRSVNRPTPVYSVPSPQPQGGRDTVTLPLAMVRERVAVPSSLANPIVAVTVKILPAGAALDLHFGHDAVPVPVVSSGEAFEFNPPHREGLFVSNPAGVDDAVIVVSFAPQ